MKIPIYKLIKADSLISALTTTAGGQNEPFTLEEASPRYRHLFTAKLRASLATDPEPKDPDLELAARLTADPDRVRLYTVEMDLGTVAHVIGSLDGLRWSYYAVVEDSINVG